MIRRRSQCCVASSNLPTANWIGANVVASALRKSGIVRGSLVGLHVERSLDQAVALLAIIKAGGAYVPLDPACPADRLATMLGDTEIRVLVTQRSLAGRLPTSATEVLCVESHWN